MRPRFAAACAVLLVLAGCAPSGTTGVQAAAAPAQVVWAATTAAQRTCTTSSSGVCTLPHDMGVVPDGVTVNLVNRAGFAQVSGKSATGVTVKAIRSVSSGGTPAVWASVSVTFEVVAVYTPAPDPTPSTTPPTSLPPSSSPPTSPPPSDEPPPPGDRACPAFPAFPDATCTGVPAGTVLTTCNGNITAANGVYDGCLFPGGVTLGPDADNVTIKNSKVIGRINAGYGADSGANGQRGLMVLDTEVDGQDELDNNESGIGDDNYTCIRCHVHRTGRGASARFNVTIVDSWFHDFDHRAGDHESAIGSNGGHDMVFRHNNLECGPTQYCSGALVVYNNSDPVDNVLVEKNLLDGGSYCTYAGSSVDPQGTNVRYLDNRFGKTFYPTCGYYGPVTHFSAGGGNVWSGNAWLDGSGPVNP